MALPLEAINAASAREKTIRHGHPSTLHLWWARRPLAACRAVLFSSIVDDPSSRPEEFPTEEAQEQERQRLFRIIERLVLWENTNNEEVLNEARQEILKATDGHPPPVLDPFCGGGSIPLEAQRLGLEAHASDLNPVAVLITKALIEIPPKFAGMPPVNPEARKKMQKRIQGEDWPGASGLADDVLYYGMWMRDEAQKRIGHLYPNAMLPDGSRATVIAWLWARTTKCPNPACGAIIPLVKSFALSKKKGKEAWINPIIINNSSNGHSIRFEVKTGQGKTPEGTVNRRGARCIVCGTPVGFDYIRSEGKSKNLKPQLMAIIAEGVREKVYLAPSEEHEKIASNAIPKDVPETNLPEQALGFRVQLYGMTKHRDLFAPRQLVALSTFCDLVAEAREIVLLHAMSAGLENDGLGINDGGKGAHAYADSVATYLAFSVDRFADYWSSLNSWQPANQQLSHTFSRQTLSMVWDFAEANIFSGKGGSFDNLFEWTIQSLPSLGMKPSGYSYQNDASDFADPKISPIISTDPPYYDNISYADLSDFFYIWIKRPLSTIYPDLFSTILVPKDQEMVATPCRFKGSKEAANEFFERRMKLTFDLMRRIKAPEYPMTVYYAYKQAESDEENTGLSSTGWQIMLDSIIESGFSITGTWPINTEMENRMRSLASNALATSILLVCRSRSEDAPLSTRKEFILALKQDLPKALRQLQMVNIAPVDLAQAAIGPGMAIFSHYSKVLEADGSPMRVRTALQLINQHLDEYLSEQEGEYDPDTRWALSWFEQYGMNEGPFGDAETLSKAKNISVEGLVQSGLLKAGGGKVRLLKREEMDPDWDPATDNRLSVWEMTQHLIRILENNGEDAASELQHKLGGSAEIARDLAYRLYAICERKGWSQEAISYNGLVIAWPRLRDLSAEKRKGSEQQALGVF